MARASRAPLSSRVGSAIRETRFLIRVIVGDGTHAGGGGARFASQKRGDDRALTDAAQRHVDAVTRWTYNMRAR